MAAVKGPSVLWYLADALHLDPAETWMGPLVNAIFNKAFNHGRAAKEFEVQLVIFPDSACLRCTHAESQWAYVHGADIVRRFR